MFRNYINKHDFTDAWAKGPPYLKKILTRIFLSKNARVASMWAHTQSDRRHWQHITEVQKRINTIISGSANINYQTFITKQFFENEKSLYALSLGSGTGINETAWAKTGKFKRIDAYDLSSTRVEVANKNAKEDGLDHILNYKTADIYKLNLLPSTFDVIFCEGSLHHFTPLEKLIIECKAALTQKGLFIINEFVGPNRFQWTNAQLSAANELLLSIPEKYRRLPNGKIKKVIPKPSILRMLMADPSEAVESAAIPPLMEKHLSPVMVKNYGGSLINLIYANIGQNFPEDDPDARMHLHRTFQAEDNLMNKHAMKSDFILAAYRKG